MYATAPTLAQIQNCSTTGDFWEKGPPFRVAIGITCFLSVLGALLIIFSYAFFQSLRNDARLILVHLSIMDLGVGLTNLIGNIIYFDQYYYPDGPCSTFQEPAKSYIRHLCVAQGFFAHYFTQGSVLWTMSLAIFLYFRILQHKTQLSRAILLFSYVFCYGMPAIICLWLVLTDRFGYSPFNKGWCSILILKTASDKPDVYVAALGYDLWIYLAMVLVPLLYLSVQVFIRQKLQQARKLLTQTNTEEKFWEAVNILGYKFLSIPVAFILLRVWTCLVGLVYVYIQLSETPFWFSVTLQYLASLGDSAQGFANAILFVMFTSHVRRTIFNIKYWKEKFCRRKREETGCLLPSDHQSLANVGINTPSMLDSDSVYTPTVLTMSGTRTGGDDQGN